MREEQNEKNIKLSKEKFSPNEILYKYLSYLPYFFISLLLTYFVAVIYIRYSNPIYQASAQILVKSNQENDIGGSTKSTGSGLDLIESSLLSNKQVNIENEILVLSSPILLAKIIKNYNLNFIYYSVGKIRKIEIYNERPFTVEALQWKDSSKSLAFYLNNLNHNSVDIQFNNNSKSQKLQRIKLGEWMNIDDNIFRINYNDSSKTLKTFSNQTFYFVYNPINSYLRQLEKQLNISSHSKLSTAIDFELKGFNQEKNIYILNTLINEFQISNFEDKRSILLTTLDFISNRLQFITNELKNVELDLKKFKTNNKIVDIPSQSNLLLNEKSTLEKALIDIDIKTEAFKFIQTEINKIITSKIYTILPENVGIDYNESKRSANSSISNYNYLVLKKQRELTLLGINSPIIQDLNNQIEAAFKGVIISLQDISQALNIEKKSINNKLVNIDISFRKIPAEENLYLNIKRQQNVKEGLYLYLLQKREETAISSASKISNYKILEFGNGSSKPILPNVPIIYFIAIIVGILIPTLIIAIKDLFNDKINNRNNIIDITKLPIIAEIGHVGGFKQNLIVANKSRNVIAEQFRILRTNISLIIKDTKIIMITSTTSGEGKSFIALNTAAVYAISNKKVALLEFDLRKPRIIKNLGIGNKNIGISNFINENINNLDGLYYSIEGFPTLDIYGCGPLPSNPSEILLSEKVLLFFNLLKEKYDYIVVDTAPIGLVSDTLNLLKYADITLYIVRQRYTSKSQLYFIDELEKNQLANNLHIIINDLKIGGRYNNYSGYGYNYYNSYGYGYEDYFNKETKNIFITLFRKIKNLFFN